MTAIKSFEKPLTPEEEVYYLNLLTFVIGAIISIYYILFLDILLVLIYFSYLFIIFI